ncbi:hypothetical protein B0F90DRAFT_1668043 [Multifurca ochricompacta]|uniref:T6SS Phospholipase effector Tle1-like catalytic domain-containing protein n=1 Tax=Multifurca ochricompacta TaxID=376703 RepID=A0AAD4M6E5_9AGAM|nr:hypothetical protein B0F90DRAFT_1668043 [Multifurca ochricompacta]
MAGVSHSQQSSVKVKVRQPKPRTIVLCFDGTANEFCDRAGIGTYFQPGAVSPLLRTVARVLDQAFAWHLPVHIMDGYTFLMQNYLEGDKVCFFGFSRGAYTARALAGMLHKVGLLSKDNFEQIPFAYKLYKSSSDKNNKLAVRFKKAYSRDVPIDFLGVWDTVASTGILKSRTLPFVGTNDTIRIFRQALSLDERRAKFLPNSYHRPVTDLGPQSLQTLPPLRRFIANAKFISKGRKRIRDTPNTARQNNESNERVREVWFAGSHSDVGGGHSDDTELYMLSNISLRWMIREIMKTESPVQFDDTAFEQWKTTFERAPLAREESDATLNNDDPPPGNLKVTSLDEGDVVTIREASTLGKSSITLARTPSLPPPTFIKRSLDDCDAVEKMGDALRSNIFWWLLEIIPTYYEWQDENGKWIGEWSIRLGRGRKLPTRPVFHESVRTRMNDPLLNYSPRARYEEKSEIYED